MKNLHIAPALLVTLLCITAAAQSSCDPVEPAVPDTTRCEGKEGDDLLDCCWMAGARDCQAGYIPLQSLYGPEGIGATSAENDAFFNRCQYEYGSSPDSYCGGYCANCPDYYADDQRIIMWGGQENADVAYDRECFCN